MANIPTMKFDAGVDAYFGEADGIKMTRNGFAPRNFAVEICAFVGAEGDAVFFVRIGTFGTIE